MARCFLKGVDPSLPKAFYAKTDDEQKLTWSVLQHNLLVGALANLLLQRCYPVVRALLPDGIHGLSAQHDIGKISPGFQGKIGNLPTVGAGLETNHAIVSEAALRTWYQAECPYAQTWAQVAGAHHGSRRADPFTDDAGVYGGESWSKARANQIQRLMQITGPLPSTPPSSYGLALATGLTCVADWLASDESLTGGLHHQLDVEQPQIGAQCLQEAERILAQAGFRNPQTFRNSDFAGLFGPSFVPNALQVWLHDAATKPGLFLVEAPMGMGKTEAALWAACRLIAQGDHDGLYFALPTRLTSNRIHERVRAFLNRAAGPDAGARLLHSGAWLCAQGGGEEFAPGGRWFAPSKRGLLHPYGVGTIDQALLGVLRVRHSFLRLFGLAGKVVIFDEVHSYDMYTGTLLRELVRTLLALRCSVIVLSATLTARQREAFFADHGDTTVSTDSVYPLISVQYSPAQTSAASAVKTGTEPQNESPTILRIPADPPPEKIYRVVVENHPDSALQEAVDQAEAGACVLWIANTVQSAQETFRKVCGLRRAGSMRIGLLHSRFPFWRREQLESEWLERLGKNAPTREGCLLCATQIVEQSVDIDADVLYTQLAPTDMLLQRIGRVWRHQRTNRAPSAQGARVHLLLPKLEQAAAAKQALELMEVSRYVYSPYVLWRSWRVWREVAADSRLVLPAVIRSLLESTYQPVSADDPAWVAELYAEHEKEKRKLQELAAAATGGQWLTTDDDEDNAPTRYGREKSVEVVLLREYTPNAKGAVLQLADGARVEVSSFVRSVAVSVALHKNAVRLSCRRLPQLPSPPQWLQRNYSPDAVALLTSAQTGALCALDGTPCALGYSDDLGVYRTDLQTTTEDGECGTKGVQAGIAADAAGQSGGGIYESDW